MSCFRKVVCAFAIAVTSLWIVGCTETAQVDYGDDPLAGLLEQARTAQASDEQIEILSSDTITYAQYESAFELTFACMTEAGLQVNRNGTVQRSGVTQLDFTFQNAPGSTLSDAERSRIFDDCYELNAFYVDIYWQTLQPDVSAYMEARAQALRQPLQECLAGYGIETDSASSFLDLVMVNSSLPEGTDCLTDIGYDTWHG